MRKGIDQQFSYYLVWIMPHPFTEQTVWELMKVFQFSGLAFYVQQKLFGIKQVIGPGLFSYFFIQMVINNILNSDRVGQPRSLSGITQPQNAKIGKIVIIRQIVMLQYFNIRFLFDKNFHFIWRADVVYKLLQFIRA